MRKYNKFIAFILVICIFIFCGCERGNAINSDTLSDYYSEESKALTEAVTDSNSFDMVSHESSDLQVEPNEIVVSSEEPETASVESPFQNGNNNVIPNSSSTKKHTEGEKVKLKYIALTFDDGPNTDNTSLVLDKLSYYNVPATFMLKGANINEKTASVMKRIVSMNCEIGNHSFEHTTSLYTSGAEYILNDYNKTEELIKKYAGVSSTFYRPPFILVNDDLRNTIPVPLISGTGCNDWDNSVTSEQRAETIITTISEGGIILLHDTSGNTKTIEALDSIIPTLKDKGYTFLTVTDLFEKCGIKATKGMLYKGAYQVLQ